MIKRVLAVLVLPFALITIAIAGEDPASVAKKTLTELESQKAAPALSGKPHPGLDAASLPIKEARKLLARAEELRRLGDTARAELAEDAALEWALTARELVRAVELEHDAVDQASAAEVAVTKAQKARSLLDEAIARRAKLQTEFDNLEKEAEARALDGGTDAGKPPKKGKP
jgi:hypothetical protein